MRKLILLLALTFLLLLCGCSRFSTVTIPAEEPSLVTEPSDTIRVEEMPLAEVDGTSTEPIEVTVYEDTSTREPVDLSWLEVDRSDPEDQTVTTRVQSGSTTVQQTFRLPRAGESLRLFADSSALRGTVFGVPMETEREAITTSIERPWYYQVGRWIELLGAMFFGAFVSYVLVKITPGL